MGLPLWSIDTSSPAPGICSSDQFAGSLHRSSPPPPVHVTGSRGQKLSILEHLDPGALPVPVGRGNLQTPEARTTTRVHGVCLLVRMPQLWLSHVDATLGRSTVLRARRESRGARCGLAATLVASGFPFSTDLVTLDTSYYCSDRQNLSRWSEKNSTKPPIAMAKAVCSGRGAASWWRHRARQEVRKQHAGLRQLHRRARRCSVVSLSPPDQRSWNEFVDRYGPRIFQWCNARGLQEADALDVSQAVLSKLAVELRQFRYDPYGASKVAPDLVRHACARPTTARGRNWAVGPWPAMRCWKASRPAKTWSAGSRRSLISSCSIWRRGQSASGLCRRHGKRTY